MQPKPFLQTTRGRAIVLIAGLVVIALIARSLLAPTIIKPEYESGQPTPNRALLYDAGDFYRIVDNNEENIALLQKDLVTFARTTSAQLQDENQPIGFTFNGGVKSEGQTHTFHGYIYGIDGKIRLTLTKFDHGVIRLSITNTKDDTNIDEQLNANGPKNRLLVTLPINKDYYSIRYLYDSDEVVVSFYEGFRQEHLDEAVKVLRDAYGDLFDPNEFVFSINAVGTFDLAGVQDYLRDPASATRE